MIIVWAKFVITVPIIYAADVVPPKLVIIHLYLSIFTQRTFRWVCYGVMAVVLGNWLGGTIVGLAACRPFSYFWTGVGKCVDINAFFRWASFANIVTDVVMLILPIPVILKLQASLRLRLGIIVTFMLGSLYVQSESPIRRLVSFNSIQWSDYFNSSLLRVLHNQCRGGWDLVCSQPEHVDTHRA